MNEELPDNPPVVPAVTVQTGDEAADIRANVFLARDFAGREIKEREWVWEKWLPREVCMTGGPPGAGKSLLMQQILTGLSVGEVFGEECEPMRCLYLTCEDDLDELHRRQADINRALGLEWSNLDNLLLRSYCGYDSRLAAKVSTGLIPNQQFNRLCDLIDWQSLDVVVLDLIPDFYPGNENDRNEVNRFVKGILGIIPRTYNCCVNFLQHPSLSGIASGTGTSGSTAWEGSVRSRLYLSPEDENGIRNLSRRKANYAGKDDGYNMRWHDGAMVPTEESYKPLKKVKGMSKNTELALDTLDAMGDHASVAKWREELSAPYLAFTGKKLTPGSWRNIKKQLESRMEISIVGDVAIRLQSNPQAMSA